MYDKTQQGKGLFSFFAGAMVTIAVVAAFLFMLNQNSAKIFKQPEVVQHTPQKPEILRPNNTPIEQMVASLPASDAPPLMPPVNKNMASASDVAVKKMPAPKVKSVGKQDSESVATKSPAPVNERLEKPKETPKKEVKSEKNQVALMTEKAKDDAPKSVNKENHAKSANIQAGAYSSKKAADEQSAKLALLGVHTRVVAVNSGGKVVYRVQTGQLQGDKAAEVQRTLKNNGINTYTYK